MKANINTNINLEIGDFRMETSPGPTIEFGVLRGVPGSSEEFLIELTVTRGVKSQ